MRTHINKAAAPTRSALAAAGEKPQGKSAHPPVAGKAPRMSIGGKMPFAKASALAAAPKMQKKVPAAVAKAPLRKRKFKMATKTLRDIARLQQTWAPLIPLASFLRLVKEVIADVSSTGPMRIQKAAVLALRDISEDQIVMLFVQANRVTLQCRHKQLLNRDFKFALNTLELLGMYQFSKGPPQPEKFPIGKGAFLQQLYGTKQIKDFRAAARILKGTPKPRARKPAAAKEDADAEAAAAEDAPEDEPAEEEQADAEEEEADADGENEEDA